jgi:4-aminobutyrate aminotransferase/(S)-3-amino-2-methylpropionate transaminase
MAAVELVTDRGTKAPAREETARIIRECYERGLLILKAGVFDNVVRLLPPLTISADDLDAGLNILEDAFAAVCA